MSDAIRSGDTLKLSAPRPAGAAVAPQATPAAPQPRYAKDAFETKPPTAEQLDRFKAAEAALYAVKRPPADIPGRREWVAQVKPVAVELHWARVAIQTAALQHGTVPREKLERLQSLEEKLALAVMEVEEECGLRKPDPPRDPNRPTGEATKAVVGGIAPTLGVSAALLPAAVIADVADMAARPSERFAYPFAKRLYEKRLAVYEQALRDHPLPKEGASPAASPKP
ncbi:MAG: hypothetical protein VKS61_14405 [Candidatus Sericytochromatia bacterium]|nr:hypothetical protein [Candidatus Sericytochromatia bacterium]